MILISSPSESHRFCDRVQDAYTLRCCPQVHGISHDTIDFVRGIITNEMNAGTDNPVRNVDLLLLFPWGCNCNNIPPKKFREKTQWQLHYEHFECKGCLSPQYQCCTSFQKQDVKE